MNDSDEVKVLTITEIVDIKKDLALKKLGLFINNISRYL